MKRVPQTPADLERHLREQLSFLRTMAAAYDAGEEAHAKPMANIVRLLVHDEGRSKSLLGAGALHSLVDAAHHAGR
jgi:hypothetical protein